MMGRKICGRLKDGRSYGWEIKVKARFPTGDGKADDPTIKAPPMPAGNSANDAFKAEKQPDDDTLGKIVSGKDYTALFNQTLAAVAEHFDEISHANRYDGRIEARTVATWREAPTPARRVSRSRLATTAATRSRFGWTSPAQTTRNLAPLAVTPDSNGKSSSN